MAETEVESILREIRERVRSEQRPVRDQPAMASGNGPGDFGNYLTHPAANETFAAESLTRINSYLTTTARAWDRLPPLVTNRSGVAARLELWLKRHFKRATRWYAWEQVNFNAAVHHALRDLLPILSAYEQELRKLHARLEAETGRLALKVETEARLHELESELRERVALLHDEHRVSFKQLALEASEAAVLEDRARRKTELHLAELTRRIEQLEKT